MPYIKQTVRAGNVTEVYKYYSGRYKKKGVSPTPRKEKTSEKQALINQEHSLRNLRWLINANFTKNDIHLVLTYRRDKRPSLEDGLHILSNALKRFRRVYKKQGLEFKYIAVTEYHNKAIHHHLIVNRIDVSLLQEKWPFGALRPTFIYSEDLTQLAAYLIKETSKHLGDGPINKRFSHSTNLKKPEIKKEIIKADSWMMIPKAPKGWILVTDSVIDYVNEFGYPSQQYVLHKIE